MAQERGFENDWVDILHKAWHSDDDSNPLKFVENGFFRIYQKAGRETLKNYLGTDEEIDFSMINRIIDRFRKGEPKIVLKRMGRESGDIRLELVDFSDVKALVIEWTHGNNPALKGIDIPAFLYSTPEETLDHRLIRARDNGADSSFTKVVLEIEQEKLMSQAKKAAFIISKNGELINVHEFLEKT